MTIEIIPGVTSLSAAAACAGIPMALLDEKIAVVPAAYDLETLPELLAGFATVFLVKVHSVFDQMLDALAAFVGPVRGVYLENIGTAEQRLVTDLESLRRGSNFLTSRS